MSVGALLIVDCTDQDVLLDTASGSAASVKRGALGCVEVMGCSLVERLAENLQAGGVKQVTVIARVFSPEVIGALLKRGIEVIVAENEDELRSQATRKMDELHLNGVRIVVAMRVDAYVEFDVDDFLQFHEENGQHITQAYDSKGPLNLWVMDTATPAHRDPQVWSLLEGGRYTRCGYVNRLRDVRDLRRLVTDTFASRCSIRPSGTEVRPGVWVDESAEIHRRARVVAPAYIGKRTKVQATALITRSSSLERDCEIGSGTVVEDACVLPNTYVGRWLDVSHAVVDGGMLVDLRANVSVEIFDSALMARAACANRRGWFNGSEHANVIQRLGGLVKKTLSS